MAWIITAIVYRGQADYLRFGMETLIVIVVVVLAGAMVAWSLRSAARGGHCGSCNKSSDCFTCQSKNPSDDSETSIR